MIEKEGEVQKTNHFRSFVSERRSQENSEERFAKLFFSRKEVGGSENKKYKEKQKRQTTKKDERNDKSKNTQIPNKGISSKTIGERRN